MRVREDGWEKKKREARWREVFSLKASPHGRCSPPRKKISAPPIGGATGAYPPSLSEPLNPNRAMAKAVSDFKGSLVSGQGMAFRVLHRPRGPSLCIPKQLIWLLDSACSACIPYRERRRVHQSLSREIPRQSSQNAQSRLRLTIVFREDASTSLQPRQPPEVTVCHTRFREHCSRMVASPRR